MSGLRARQKADRERRIVDAATRLFRKTGFENTKIETIAELAEVSIGTVYNYYQSKGDLLVAIVSMEVNEVLNAGAALVDDPPPDLEEAVNALISIYLDHSLHYLDKDMWRNAMALATRLPDSPQGRIYNELDDRLTDQVCALIERMQAAGMVRPDADARAVGEMFFNNTNMMFMIFVKSGSMKLSRLKEAIRRQNRPLAHAVSA